MKIFLLVVGAVTAIIVLAQTNVPSAVLSSFTKLFPGTTVKKWDREEGKYEANFTKEGKRMSAVFDTNGTLEETETTIPVIELPAPVVPYIRDHYKGSKLEEATMVLKPNGEKIYEAEIKGKDLMFDAKGKFLKEETEKGEGEEKN
jgi:hypothetical protein